ncbi:unnamed protein product [Staurois parvus]|uniref:Secreted protein n=1 Tax=Staurois parvus TaxID=386267 RepID=A0ABN9ACQ5_9NEOB|nr:unnamed protein product [Staurois parvus]
MLLTWVASWIHNLAALTRCKAIDQKYADLGRDVWCSRNWVREKSKLYVVLLEMRLRISVQYCCKEGGRPSYV